MLMLAAIILVALVAPASAIPPYYAPANDVLPGYGPEFANGDAYGYSPMAFGLFASAFANDGLIEDAKRAADWLVESDDLNGDGRSGWGLPYAWDAFGDGSENPAHTVYGITLAVAVQGLLDVHEVTQETVYLDTAVAALEAYASYFRDGAFWYSEAAEDRKPVHNVTAMLMGQYARASRVAGREDFGRLADEAYAYLMAQANDDGTVLWWSYGEGYPKVNDLVHAAYMTRALIDYGAPQDVIDRSVNDLRRFARDDVIYDYVDRDDYLGRVWGLGALLNVACEVGDSDLRGKVEAALPAYLDGDVYQLRPGEGEYSPRLQAHVAWGFSNCP